MAKRKGHGRGKRDGTHITKDPLSLLFSSGISREVEDRREFNPLGDLAPSMTVFSTPVRFKASEKNQKPFSYPASPVVFDDFRNALVCARRARRREVIFASGFGGARGRRGRYRRNFNSNISCSE